ncbi:MAG TPA: hypothetical protein P5255_10475 [Phycisphaerae bacterium]|nr:hypothetical protein [Phycisphaerae bacterium]
MKKPPLYVLDTGIVIHLIRANALGRHVSATYHLGAVSRKLKAES